MPDLPPAPAPGRRPDPVPPEVAGRLRHWVRTCLGLGQDETVVVTQLAGCTPVETVLAVLGPGAPVRRSFSLPADLISVADVQRAFTTTPAVPPRSNR